MGFSLAKKLARFINGAMAGYPNLPVTAHNLRLIKLGTAYGGWTFVDSEDLHGATIISCGLGEDASFDIEFASRFNAKVVVVDPTPRAIKHFNNITDKFGSKANARYSNTGKQPVEAYDLSLLKPGSLQLVEKALWHRAEVLKFFTPKNTGHVSHSIVNYQHNYRQNTAHINVESTTIDSVLHDLGIADLSLIKLDIEGAEIEVILDMMQKQIYPRQILVEYDELSIPSRKSKTRIQSAHNELLKHGYQLVNRDHPSNFLYFYGTPHNA